MKQATIEKHVESVHRRYRVESYGYPQFMNGEGWPVHTDANFTSWFKYAEDFS